MKYILSAFFFILESSWGFAQGNYYFTIMGQLPNLSNDGSYAYLISEDIEDIVSKSYGEQVPQKAYIDSVKIQEGQFVFNHKGNKEGELYTVKVQNSNISSWIIGESGKIKVIFKKKDEATIHSYVSGTLINQQMTDEILIPSYVFASKVDSINKEKDGRVSPKIFIPYALEYYKSYSKFIKTHIHFPAGECFWIMFPPLNKEDQNEILPEVSEHVKQLYEKKQAVLTRREEYPDSVKIGQNFIDFTLTALTNKNIKLSEVVKTNKLVLLDFWASWCGPCLREIPELIEIYANYKDRGLEIIGISNDREDESWKKTIERNKMHWPQAMDQKINEKYVSEIYGITSIPHIILIDQSGKIISRGIRGKQLKDTIKQVIIEK